MLKIGKFLERSFCKVFEEEPKELNKKINIFEILPKDNTLHILSFCSLQIVVCFKQACKNYNELVDENFWNLRGQQRFGREEFRRVGR